jgi:hypothetical protein
LIDDNTFYYEKLLGGVKVNCALMSLRRERLIKTSIVHRKIIDHALLIQIFSELLITMSTHKLN